jgi:hypothetical protein
VPRRVLATLEALRDQVRDEILRDPRYLTYQALERSIHDIKAALEGAHPSGRLERGPGVLGRVVVRSEPAVTSRGGKSKPNGAVDPGVGDIIHPRGMGPGGTGADAGIARATDPGGHRSVAVWEPSAAWENPKPPLAASTNGSDAPHGRPPTTHVDSEAMANLQHALIDLINGDHPKGAGRQKTTAAVRSGRRPKQPGSTER